MRNKRLIILLSILGGLALIVIITSVVFSVYAVEATCKNTVDKNLNGQVTDACGISFTSIFMVNKEHVIENVNDKVARAEMYSVEKVFPNKIKLHYNKIYTDISFAHSGETYYASQSGKIIGKESSLTADTGDPESPISVTLGQAPASTETGKYLNESESEDMTALEVLIGGLTKFRLKEQDTQPFTKDSYRSIDLSGADVIIKTTTGVVFELRCNTLTGKRADASTMLQQLSIAVSMYVYDKDENKPSISNGRYIVTYTLKSHYSPI